MKPRPCPTLPRPVLPAAAVLALVLLPAAAAPRDAADDAPARDTPPLDALGTLDLDTARRIALRNNPSLALAAARVDQARARLAQARSSYWPRLELSAGAARVDLSPRSEAAAFGAEDPQRYYSAELGATWVLFDGLARRFNTATAKYGNLQSEAALDDARRLLLSGVDAAFYHAQLAREQIAIAEADERFNARLHSEAAARREKGIGSLGDELNFEVRMNAARSGSIEAARDYALARVGLAALLGAADGRLPEDLAPAPLRTVSEEEMAVPDVDALLERALTQRPDVRQARAGVAAARAGVGAARGDFYPDIVVTGAVEGERPEEPGFEGDDFGNTVALGLSFALFDGFLRGAREREARGALHEAEQTLRSVRLTAAAEVRRAAASLRSAREQLTLQRRNVELVTRTRELVEREYRAGETSLARLNEAQRDAVAARTRLAQARLALRRARSDLHAAAGTEQWGRASD